MRTHLEHTRLLNWCLFLVKRKVHRTLLRNNLPLQNQLCIQTNNNILKRMYIVDIVSTMCVLTIYAYTHDQMKLYLYEHQNIAVCAGINLIFHQTPVKLFLHFLRIAVERVSTKSAHFVGCLHYIWYKINNYPAIYFFQSMYFVCMYVHYIV